MSLKSSLIEDKDLFIVNNQYRTMAADDLTT